MIVAVVALDVEAPGVVDPFVEPRHQILDRGSTSRRCDQGGCSDDRSIWKSSTSKGARTTTFERSAASMLLGLAEPDGESPGPDGSYAAGASIMVRTRSSLGSFMRRRFSLSELRRCIARPRGGKIEPSIGGM